MLLKDQGVVIGPVTAINCGVGLSATRALGVGTIVPATLSHVRVVTATAGSYATGAIIQYITEDYDTLAEFTPTVTWKFTAANAGYYHVVAAILADTQAYTAGNSVQLSVRKNGTIYAVGNLAAAPTTASWFLPSMVSTTMLLAVGDILDFTITHSKATNVTLIANRDYNYVTIDRLF